MNKMNTKYILLSVAFLCSVISTLDAMSQNEADPGKQLVSIRYFNTNNSIQYLLLQSQLRKDNQVSPQKGKSYVIYMDSQKPENMMATVKTDENGKAKAFIPPGMKSSWDSSSQHIFIVMEGEEEKISDYVISKAHISIDTSTVDSVRNISVKVMKWENENWTAAPNVEMKIGVKRLGGILSAGDDETYTSDSSGTATVELSKSSLPGDKNGNFIISAKVEDNDIFGNLLVEKKVPWGVAVKVDDTFFEKRTLWSTRFRTPYWLLFMASGIIIGVWGTLIYLIFQMSKIKKLGIESL